MRKRYLWVCIYILLTTFIFTRSLHTAEVSTDESRFLVQFVERIIRLFYNPTSVDITDIVTVVVRKAAHVVEFAALSCAACRMVYAFEKKLRDFIAWVLFSGLLTACIDEAIQLTSPGRAGLISDVFIDFGGTILGICFTLALIFINSKLRKKA